MARDNWYYEPDKDRPCPWCGGTAPAPDMAEDELLMEVGQDGQGHALYYVTCQSCGCIGPDEPSPGLAWAAWNRRPAR